jgi:hypothetical protein
MGKSETKKNVVTEQKETKQETKEKTVKQTEQKQEETQEQNKFENQLSTTQEECSKLKELVKSVSESLKKLQSSHKSEVKKMSTKKSKKTETRTPTGFARLRPVTGKLATFIGVESGTELSGPEITKRVWGELKNRGLTYKGDEKKGVKGDQRVLRVDKEVSQLFNVPMSVNNSTSHKDANGFNFGNLQKYIKNAMTTVEVQDKKEDKKEKVATK